MLRPDFAHDYLSIEKALAVLAGRHDAKYDLSVSLPNGRVLRTRSVPVAEFREVADDTPEVDDGHDCSTCYDGSVMMPTCDACGCTHCPDCDNCGMEG